MWRYIGKRILQGIPTIVGIVFITFILFNVVGGSPAAHVLGQNASARSLEEFDTSRGYAKPLFFGRWSPTRALPDANHTFVVADSEIVPLPLAFSLPPNTNWRLDITARGPGKLKLVNVASEDVATETFSTVWKKKSLVFHSMENPAFTVENGSVEIRSISLRREGRGWWDSQLAHFLSRLLHLDFEVSSSLNQPVIRLIASGIGPSLALTVPIFRVELAVSLSLALICAYRRGTLWDRSLTLTCIVLMSVNYLVWIILGQYLLAYRLGWFPVWGFESWKNLCLPVLVGVVTGLGVNVRFYRTILLEEMNKEYVRMARAKGLSDRRILFKHVLKNAMAPVITNTAMAIPFLYTGSLMLEGFFGIPGLGYLSLNAIHSSDVEVVRAVVLVGAVLCTMANMLADIAYAWVDPRVKLG